MTPLPPLQARDDRRQYTIESSNRRVIMYGMIELAVVVACSGAQVGLG